MKNNAINIHENIWLSFGTFLLEKQAYELFLKRKKKKKKRLTDDEAQADIEKSL